MQTLVIIYLSNISSHNCMHATHEGTRTPQLYAHTHKGTHIPQLYAYTHKGTHIPQLYFYTHKGTRKHTTICLHP